ncbi:hypothetical protein E2C01_026866 [Portunus trituberculatus]|uniref:Uncharacterized protein n=1 Tax=Portunus trituberculatus TaxID=210409 RepID=A0A5B7EM71_PORTR|nr:hypothetical protein [Portunus trituberculatus]
MKIQKQARSSRVYKRSLTLSVRGYLSLRRWIVSRNLVLTSVLDSVSVWCSSSMISKSRLIF